MRRGLWRHIFDIYYQLKGSEMILKNHNKDLKLLEMNQKDLESAIELFYSSTPTLPNTGPQAAELLSNLVSDLETIVQTPFQIFILLAIEFPLMTDLIS